ncbi:MAG: glycoside hydrolase family 15 protein [Desulfobaccales bacterium]
MVKDSYLIKEIDNLLSLLQHHETFTFPFLDNGLFPAAALKKSSQYTGYSNVWIRDNIYVSYAHYLNHQVAISLKNVRTFVRYFIIHKWRLEKIIAGELDYHDPMNRPHIRFKGIDLSEIKQKWAQAENDALGYFVWFLCKIYRQEKIIIKEEEKELLALFAFYFDAIRYWEDEDSGHWEETRKIEASSIGVVVGALEELRTFWQNEQSEFGCFAGNISRDFLDSLITRGHRSLQAILPAECIQPDPLKYRRYDAALLFLLFPMNLVVGEKTDQILSDVTNNLQGDYGIRRYPGDSYWSADYKDKLEPGQRTIDYSDNIAVRNKLLKPGQEAQWCIFDPIISIIYGFKYQKSGDQNYFRLQIHYFNRSLGQLTAEDSEFGGFKCPELYYLERGQYVPNDTVPLLWTQANLWMAFKFMRDSLTLKNS